MIGPGWAGEEDPERSRRARASAASRRRVAVVTGSRADYGLLRSVMLAIAKNESLELQVVAAGSHLLDSGRTLRDVRADFDVHDLVPMQKPGKTARADDAEALGRGVEKFARSFGRLEPTWVVVLGDRIEAFAAASAASVGGWALAHIHGGDRAEGIADEAMRHAITKLAHLHLAATDLSAERLRRMGERPDHVQVVGSPAIDGLAKLPALPAERWKDLGEPSVVLLMHPVGRPDEQEEHAASIVLEALAGERVLALAPNHDPGRTGVQRALESSGCRVTRHLKRAEFVGLLRRLADAGGVLVGNSSAALIEASALGLPSVDVGPRQAGRERPSCVVHTDGREASDVREALERAKLLDRSAITHPYGDGRAGDRIAALLAHERWPDAAMLRKRCAY